MEERNSTELIEPPLPEDIKNFEEPPQMSEAATLGNIFFEPGRTFEDLRRKPRFVMAFLITVILFGVYVVAFQQKMGDERYRQFITEQIDKNPQAASLPAEQKKKQIELSVTFTKYFGYAMPVLYGIFIFIGGLFYWLGVKAFGGVASYLQSLAVFVYSSFAPTVMWFLANALVLFLKSPDEIDIATSSRGVIHANPSMFLNGKEMPVLATLVSSIDFFLIWGFILAAIGLHKVGRISKGTAWAIVLILGLTGITFRILLALISGNPS